MVQWTVITINGLHRKLVYDVESKIQKNWCTIILLEKYNDNGGNPVTGSRDWKQQKLRRGFKQHSAMSPYDILVAECHKILRLFTSEFTYILHTSCARWKEEIIPGNDFYVMLDELSFLQHILNPKRNVTNKLTALFHKMRLHGLFASCKSCARCFLGQMPNLNPMQWSETFVSQFERFARPARYLYFRVLIMKVQKLVRSKGNIPKQRKIIRNY